MSALAVEAAVEVGVPGPRQEQSAAPVSAAPVPVQRVRTARVRVPWRLVVSPSSPDAALAVYIKVAALGLGNEGWCQAKAATIARFLRLSRATAERGLSALVRPAPEDGVVELETIRRTMPGGRGASAMRRVREHTATEPYVWVRVAAAEDLTPRQLRAYVAMVYAQQMKIGLTMAELAGYLRNHSGKRQGEPISADAAAAVVNEVEAARWATVQRRAGARGRHLLIAHDIAPEGRPHAPVEAPQGLPEEASGADVTTVDNASSEAAGTRVGEGSGGAVGEGSLAYMELPTTDSPDDVRAAWSPAVGEVQVEEAVENAADATFEAAAASGGRGLALRAGGKESPQSSTNAPAAPVAKAATKSGDYTGPGLQVPARVYAVLEPVHRLYQQANVFMQRRIAREVADQLNTGTHPERLRHRLERRYAQVMSDDVRDPARWLLGVGLPRWGCGHQDCEAGLMWTTGKVCDVCAEVCADRAAQREQQRRERLGLCPQHGTRPGRGGSCVDCDLEHAIRYPVPAPVRAPEREPGVPVGNCADCGARTLLVDQALVDGLCRTCRDLAGHPAPEPVGEAFVQCAGAPGEPCPREALPTRAVCLRHRSQELAAETAAAAGGGRSA